MPRIRKCLQLYKQWIPWILLVVVFGLSFSARSLLSAGGIAGPIRHEALPFERPMTNPPQRIVSLAPSVTEVLFALDLGEKVVGVTSHCRYPPSALSKGRVGDYYQPAYETILSLRPDLVVLLPEHEEAERYLSSLGVSTLRVDHFSIEGVLDSILLIGRICGAEVLAQQMLKDIQGRMGVIQQKAASLDRPRVMVSVGRNMGPRVIKDIYICGQDGFYSEMIMLAGGKNAYEGGEMKFPIISGEGIVRLNPQVILDVVPDLAESGWKEEDVVGQWGQLSGVDAVAHERVYVLSHNYAVVPGPRFILILEDMARRIHPEISGG